MEVRRPTCQVKVVRILVAFGCVVALVACDATPAFPPDWEGSIDSVGATVVVRNPAGPLWESGQGWTGVPELWIGSLDGTGPEVFGWISALAVSPSGSMAILDAQASEVRIFEPDGRHARTFGREGSGPGELSRPLSIHFDSNGSLWVSDPGNARYSVFDSVGRFLSTRRRMGGASAGSPGVMTSDDRLIDVFPSLRDGRIDRIPVRIDTRTGQMDSLPPIRGKPLPGPPVPARLAPFMSQAIHTFDVNGHVWIAWTDSLLLYRRAPSGDTVRIVHLPFLTSELSPTEEDSLEAVIQQWPFPVDRGDLGVGPQGLQALYADEVGHLFVRTREPDRLLGSGVEVLDSIGRYLGRLALPVKFADRPPPVFRHGHVYGIVLDSLGVNYLVRARIVRSAEER